MHVIAKSRSPWTESQSGLVMLDANLILGSIVFRLLLWHIWDVWDCDPLIPHVYNSSVVRDLNTPNICEAPWLSRKSKQSKHLGHAQLVEQGCVTSTAPSWQIQDMVKYGRPLNSDIACWSLCCIFNLKPSIQYSNAMQRSGLHVRKQAPGLALARASRALMGFTWFCRRMSCAMLQTYANIMSVSDVSLLVRLFVVRALSLSLS